MNRKQFELVAPAINTLTIMNGVLWRVSYHNPNKCRVTTEAVGVIVKSDPKDQDSPNVVKLLATGKIYTQEAFEAFRRATWPLAHEKDRNPKNTTLGVKSGRMGAKGGF